MTMICVTGAGGTLSSEIIKQLESAKAELRAAHSSDKAAETARGKGRAPIRGAGSGVRSAHA
jgi:hypothetical protein